MLRRTMIEGGALVALGALGLVGALGSYLNMDPRMASSTLKPGMFISALSVGLILTGLAHGYGGIRAAHANRRVDFHEEGRGIEGIVYVVFAAVALYAVAIPLIGYVPTTFAFLLVQFRVLGVRSWPVNLLSTLVVTACFYLVFIHYGGLAMPSGGWLD